VDARHARGRAPDRGSRTVIASSLPTPIGMVRRRGFLYVSTFSRGRGTVRGRGKVVRVPL